ncbi:FMN-binding negative transcriptional regulator [Sphingorhabdus sp.]|jgi:transcriptional regulator|uniref:FMN-binding negative transcriptional regulator n=1 Tax=Sphingorhabdus sp. TaxID=1902408 RepID=UPI0037CAB95F
MHPNAAFRWEDRDAMRALAKDIGFGMLFLNTPDGPHVAHLPFVFLDDDRIGFHMARNNAIARHLDDAEALFVINGPDGYISPDYYGIPDQVPTWNYVAIELVGSVRKMDEAALISQSDALSHHQESKLAPKPVWTRAKMADGMFEKMLRGIYGFEMHITTWRSTLKLGQNKAEAVRLSAADGAEEAGNIAIANAMRNLTP